MYLREKDGDMFLRPMIEDDLEFMLDIRNETRELIHNNRIFTLDEAIEWYHTTQPENYIVAIHSDKVGIIRVRRGKQHAQLVELGGDIHKKYRRRGYAMRAYHVIIPYLFDSSEVEEIVLEILAINMSAFNLYHKLGFEVREFVPNMARRPGRDLGGFMVNLTQEKWETK